LADEDRVESVLADGEEVLFELESYDQWLHVIFNMLDRNKLLVYGRTDMWSKMLRSESCLYVMDSFDLKTSEDELGSQYKLMND
jgi:hypothetical protein